MIKCIFSAAILAGLLFAMAGAVQAESSYSPVLATSPSTISAASSGSATSTYFTQSNGSYITSGNWNAGTPTSSLNAYIGGSGTSGYTANLSSGGQSTKNLYLGTGSIDPSSYRVPAR